MIIHDRNVFRPFGRPSKAHPPLPVDADTVLTCAITLQGFELIARRGPQIGKPGCSIEHVELAQRYGLKRAPPTRADAVPEETFGAPVGKAPDHVSICVTYRVSVKPGEKQHEA